MQEDALNEQSRDDGFVRRAEALRTAFDQRFREAAVDELEATVDVLVVSVGRDRVGVLVEQTAQLVARPKVVRIPDADPGCLGVLGHLGRLVAVFDLAPDVGTTATTESGAIVIVARRDSSIGFAAGRVLGYHRAPRSALIAPPDASDTSRVGTLVSDEPIVVLSLDELVQRLERDSGDAT